MALKKKIKLKKGFKALPPKPSQSTVNEKRYFQCVSCMLKTEGLLGKWFHKYVSRSGAPFPIPQSQALQGISEIIFGGFCRFMMEKPTC